MSLVSSLRHTVGAGARASMRAVGYELVSCERGAQAMPQDAWSDGAYQAWFEAHRPTLEELAAQQKQAEQFAIQPKFSFIVPLYKTKRNYLDDVVTSVLNQTYSNLELVLVNASPEDAHLCNAVEAYRVFDSRIVVVTLEQNYGITKNTDLGIQAATGDFLCFLDHDDFIELSVLFEYVKAINENPVIDFLYCDEDMVEACENHGHSREVVGLQDEHIELPTTWMLRKWRHQHPLFKPDFSPELLLCKNYIIHLLTVRRSLYLEMPTPTSVFDGSQDYNLTLATSFKARAVYHVPKVLYHWRISAASTATNPDSKPYGHTSNRMAIQGHIERFGLAAFVSASGIAFLHNLWFRPGTSAKVSIIIPVESDSSLALTQFELLRQSNSYCNVQIVLVGDGAQNICIQDDNVVTVENIDANASLLQKYNAGAQAACGDYVVFLPVGSMFLTPEPIEQLLGLLSIEGVGVAAPKTLYSTGQTKCYGIAMTKECVMPLYRGLSDEFPGYQCNIRAFQNPLAVSYEGMITSRELFLELGGFDVRYDGQVAAADYCARVALEGYRCVQTPCVKLLTSQRCPSPRYNYEPVCDDFSESDQALFYEKWPSWRTYGDAMYNANLNQSTGYQQLSSER